MNFIDNHDVAALPLRRGQGDKDALRNALLFLITEEGIPCLYYGTEQDFPAATIRRTARISGTRGYATEHRARSGGSSELAALRRKLPGAHARRQKVRLVDGAHGRRREDAGIFAFERGRRRRTALCARGAQHERHASTSAHARSTGRR